MCGEFRRSVETEPMPHKSAECPICLDELKSGDKSIITVKCCNNQFHPDCYIQVMAIKRECPLCRTKFVNVLHEHATTAIGDTVIRVDSVNVSEHEMLTMRKRNHLLFALALGVCIFYLLVNLNGH